MIGGSVPAGSQRYVRNDAERHHRDYNLTDGAYGKGAQE